MSLTAYTSDNYRLDAALSSMHASPLPLLPEYDYTPRVILHSLPLYAICLPHTLPYVSLVNISSNHPSSPYFILSYSCRKESRCIHDLESTSSIRESIIRWLIRLVNNNLERENVARGSDFDRLGERGS